ncbi:tetratricopeptide repeat protein [Hymenobacter rubidus]|uniref:tetratricopeptide repeat protein n=1 Tax=Hymenobacter rubidus TaxID=1441626 RepID=UPI00191D8C8C|nr:tetratricopeptide repeat protein [Hymenobacter rubidus]
MNRALLSVSIFRVVLLGALLCLGLTTWAQSAEETKAYRTAIDAFYPVMIAHVNAGRLNEARLLCQKAIEWDPQNPVHRYNLACIESKAGNNDKAIAALSQATARGFNDPNSLRTDPDLAAVRADARFAGMVQLAARNRGEVPATAGLAATPVRAYAPAAPAVAATRRAAAPAVRAAALGPLTNPAPASWTGGKLTGLYFMTRFWISSGSLEKAVWYFSPDGRVYHNPTGGFAPAVLAAGAEQKGTFSLSGGKLSIAWSDGKKDAADFTPNSTSFSWNAGIFVPVKSFANAGALVGRYEGGNSISGASSSSTIELRADGTYSQSGAGSVSSTTKDTYVSGGASSRGGGRWQLTGYTLTLTDGQGQATQGIAFPYDDPKTTLYPDRFYFLGVMYNKKQ